MFVDQDIKNIIAILTRRRASLFHACQFLDFKSYMTLGGIPSRALLKARSLPFTPFETDHSDVAKGFDDLVFVNLADFGGTFAGGHGATPNAYGPILIELRPSALTEAVDIAVCLRSAGAQGFNRSKESLACLDDFEKIWADTAVWTNSKIIKKKAELRKLFPLFPAANQPELSLRCTTSMISLSHVAQIIADPYQNGAGTLKHNVNALLTAKTGWSGPLAKERPGADNDVYNQLQHIVARGARSAQEILSADGCGEKLRTVVIKIQAAGLNYQIKRYATYLVEGTLTPLNWMLDLEERKHS